MKNIYFSILSFICFYSHSQFEETEAKQRWMVLGSMTDNSVFMKFLYPKKKDGATDEASEKPAKVKNEVKTPDAGIQVSHKPSLNHSQDQFISTDKAQAFPATLPIASAVYAFRPQKSPTQQSAFAPFVLTSPQSSRAFMVRPLPPTSYGFKSMMYQ